MLVRGLKLIDDVFWGSVPRKRVKWLTYDSGIKPVKKARDAQVRGSAAAANTGNAALHESSLGAAPDESEKLGYYYPLKENTKRFAISEQRANRSK